MKSINIKCLHCGSEEVVKRGTFETKAHGKQQRFFCKKCGKKFIVRTGFYRMRNNAQKITASIDLFYNGLSTRKVQAHLKAFFPHNASNVSVYNWVIKYSKMIGSFTDKLKIKTGRELQADEIEFKRKGKKAYFLDNIDTKTRFALSSKFCDSRDMPNFKEVFKMAKQKLLNAYEVITTDGYLAYPRAVKVMGVDKRYIQKGGTIHIINNASRGGSFNFPIERLHNTIRQRTEGFRGFHGSREKADLLMCGLLIYYNFVRNHQGIKCCPYELATDLELNNPNRWMDLIELSS